ADAAAAVADEMSEPGAHRLADEMLLHDAELARLPERPDLLQERIDHIAEHRVERVQRERLVEPHADLADVALGRRGEDCVDVLARRPRSRDIGLAEQQRGLADPISLAEPRAQPFDPRDVPLAVAALPARRDRKSTRLNSSHVAISYAVFCLKKKKHFVTAYITIAENKLEYSM